MDIFYDFKNIENLSLGLGFFDGVHIAHKKIIDSVVNYAQKNGTKSAIITFTKSPICYLDKNIDCKYITSNEKKTELISSLGVDYLFFIDFLKLKNIEAENYIKLLVKYFSPRAIVTGFNNNFGIGGEGNPNLLYNKQEKYNYKYFKIEPQKINDELISSTLIRNAILDGNIEKANKFLGRNFSIQGTVKVGNKLGRTINFPTANITWEENILRLPYGVYSGEVKINNKIKKAIINWGCRPTVDNKETVEAHILEFNEDIYNQKIEIIFKKFIRKQTKFSSLEELKKQIETDIKYTEY